MLQAREILGLTLNADLVTLSACDAAGTFEAIAGNNSLVEAFSGIGHRPRECNLSRWMGDGS